MINLDNAASTCVTRQIYEKTKPYLIDPDLQGNPGSPHQIGRMAHWAVDEARKNVSKLIHCGDDGEIIFTSGGSESNVLAICGNSYFLQNTGKRHIIISQIEHKSVLNSTKKLERDFGVSTTHLAVDEFGHIDLGALQKEIETTPTGLVSIMYSNNEISCIQDIASIGSICKKNGVVFHTDCVQAAGFYDIDVDSMGIDMLSISGHKIHAMKGIGCLYIRDKSLVEPIIVGGGQEYGIRAGTENVPAIVSLGAACEYCTKNMNNIVEKVNKLESAFLSHLDIDVFKGRINGDKNLSRTKIINVFVPGIDAETLLLMLDANGVCASAGSACNSKESIPSHVLKAVGLSDQEARSSIRFSFSDHLSVEDASKAGDIVKKCINKLRRV